MATPSRRDVAPASITRRPPNEFLRFPGFPLLFAPPSMTVVTGQGGQEVAPGKTEAPAYRVRVPKMANKASGGG